MARNLRLRSKVATATRVFMEEQGFLEVETPILFKSTPEGAREFLIPARTNPGLFYALPQSPQQFKQILMVAGVERYFQIARCIREEDQRADRQLEITQIDLEMSFIDRENVIAIIEGLLRKIWKEILNVEIPIPIPHMQYDEAMSRYGSDRPDLRFGMELHDITDIGKKTDFKVFSGEGINVCEILGTFLQVRGALTLCFRIGKIPPGGKVPGRLDDAGCAIQGHARPACRP